MRFVPKIIARLIRTLFRGSQLKAVTYELAPSENALVMSGRLPAICTPLTAPGWLSACNASHMLPDDPVLGLLTDGAPYALPWWIMKNHHVANLTLGKRPIVVKLCEMCSSAVAFNPVVQGTRLTFQMIGAYKGTFVTRDFETHSLWAPFTGECLMGPLKGKQLEQLPLYQSTWAEWTGLYPESFVPDGRGESREGHGAGMYPGSAESEKGLMETIAYPDGRLTFHELVLGVKSDGRVRAYPLAKLDLVGPVLNEDLGAHKIVIFSKLRSWMAIAFARELDGECLHFELSDDGKIIDRNTKSVWGLSGQALAGPLAGRKLSFIPSEVEEWYVWAAYHPDTEIFDVAGRP